MSAAETGKWSVSVAEWLYSTDRERVPNAWLILDANGQPIDLRYSLETMERIVAAVNAQSAPLSDGALARLEQTWRERAEARMREAKTPLINDVAWGKQRGMSEAFADCADELAALRARGETSEQLICSAFVMPDGYIVRGHRHGDCLRTINGMPRYKGVMLGPETQGFMTSANRFVGREEALKIFTANGGELKCGGNTLTSEELW